MKRVLLGIAAGILSAFSANAATLPIGAPDANEFVLGESGSVTATFDFSNAGFDTDLYLVTGDGNPATDILLFNNKTTASGTTFDLGAFDAGTELVFRLYVKKHDISYFSGNPERNIDGIAHAKVFFDVVTGTAIIGFEDQLRGGDFDFDDFVIRIAIADVVNPLPGAGLLFLSGLGAFGFARRNTR